MYVLRNRSQSSQLNIEIDADRYNALKDALTVQGIALELEEKFNLVMENYEEFEREILTITLAYMVRSQPTWGSMFSDRLLLDRQIVNLLNTGYLYAEQIERLLKKSSTQIIGCTWKQAEAVFSEQSKKNPGYRIMVVLRHHFQHCSLAVRDISYPSRVEVKAEKWDEPLWSYKLDLKLDMEALRRDRRGDRETLKELESLQPNQKDLILFIRQYIEGLGHVQNQLRKLTEAAVDKADATSDAALMEWQTAGYKAIGLIASNFSGGTTAEEHVFVTNNLKEKRVEMVAAHSSFTNLSRRFVSGVRPSDAYPPIHQETESDDKS